MTFTFDITNIGCFGKLNEVVSIETTEKMLMEDLYEVFDRALKISAEAKLYSTRFLKIKVDNEMRNVVSEFNLERFAKINKLNPNNIEVEYGYGGIGETEMLNDYIKLQIRPLEEKHRKSPHVHVSMDKGRNYVSIRLKDFNIEDGNNCWKNFSRTDKKDIMCMLKEYRDEFIRFYNEPLEKGLLPNPVKFVFRGKEHWLG